MYILEHPQITASGFRQKKITLGLRIVHKTKWPWTKRASGETASDTKASGKTASDKTISGGIVIDNKASGETALDKKALGQTTSDRKSVV